MKVYFEDTNGRWWKMDARLWTFATPTSAKSNGEDGTDPMVGQLVGEGEMRLKVQGSVTAANANGVLVTDDASLAVEGAGG